MSNSVFSHDIGLETIPSGKNLIFVISLPRSGSTLLQHILARHPDIGATAEPWIMFPSALALRKDAIWSDYNPHVGRLGLTEFLSQLHQGEQEYYRAIARMAYHLYEKYLTEHNKTRFVDKTSRYYLILPELFQIFPEANYVFLVRNPLAVFSSFLENMVCGDWRRLGEPGIRNDLTDGYRLILQGIRYFGDDAIVIKYEDLVSRPEFTISTLCQSLKIPFVPDMLNYGESGILEGTLVDPKSIHKHRKPVTDYLESWKTKLSSSQSKLLASGFLLHLGKDLVTQLGYPYSELLENVVPSKGLSFPQASWELVSTPTSERSHLQRWHINLTYTWQTEGWLSAFRLFFSSLLRRAANCIPTQNRRRIKEPPNSHRKPMPASDNYQVVDGHVLAETPPEGWKNELVAKRQLDAYLQLLKEMYNGNPRKDFQSASLALQLTKIISPSVLEIGCGNGYYYEILKYLSRKSFRYIGLDYSEAMLRSAKSQYNQCAFVLGDATQLPFAPKSFDIVWSGTVLMHIVQYAQAIKEASRVSRYFCIFHSTPVLTDDPTLFLKKRAYGEVVPEVLVNEKEFLELLHKNGLSVKHILDSYPYEPNTDIKGKVKTYTYVCRKR